MQLKTEEQTKNEEELKKAGKEEEENTGKQLGAQALKQGTQATKLIPGHQISGNLKGSSWKDMS